MKLILSGCSTGDAIRALLQAQQLLLVSTDTNADSDVCGRVLEGESEPGISIHVQRDIVAVQLLRGPDAAIDIDSVLRGNPGQDYMADRNPVQMVVRYENNTTVLIESSVSSFDRLSGMRDWERRNQPSLRPPRHLTKGRRREK